MSTYPDVHCKWSVREIKDEIEKYLRENLQIKMSVDQSSNLVLIHVGLILGSEPFTVAVETITLEPN